MKSDRPQNRNLKPWKPGQSGNPAGRPVGARNKLAEAFIADYQRLWEREGVGALERLLEQDVGAFCKIAVALAPKELTVNLEFRDQLSAFLDGMEDVTPVKH